MTATRRRLILAVRYGVGLAALAWLAGQADWAVVAGTVHGLGGVAIAAILALTVVESLARFVSWHVLLSRLGATRFATAAGVDLTIGFVNQVLPSRVVGRSLAPVVLRQYTGYPWSALVAVAGVHTALYATLYGLVALAGLAIFAGRLSPGLFVVVGAAAAAYAALGPAILLAGTRLDGAVALAAAARARVPIDRVPRLGRLFDRFSDALPGADAAADSFRALATDHRAVVPYVAAWTTARMVVPGTRTWLLLDAAGVGFSPPLLLPVALVTAYAVTLLPLTPGGVGVAEASATLVLAALGVPAAVGAPTVLIDRFLGVYLPALAGWYPTMRLDVLPSLADEE